MIVDYDRRQNMLIVVLRVASANFRLRRFSNHRRLMFATMREECLMSFHRDIRDTCALILISFDGRRSATRKFYPESQYSR